MGYYINILTEPTVYDNKGRLFFKQTFDFDDTGASKFTYEIQSTEKRSVMLTTSFVVLDKTDRRLTGRIKFSLVKNNQVLASCESKNIYYCDELNV